MAKLLILKHFVPSHTKLTAANVRKFPFLEFSPRWELATRSRRRALPTIIFWASLINLEFAAAFILSIETRDCRIPFRNIAHRNEPTAARLAAFAMSDQVSLTHYSPPRQLKLHHRLRHQLRGQRPFSMPPAPPQPQKS